MLVDKQLLAKVDNPLETRVRTPRSDFGRFVSNFANPRSRRGWRTESRMTRLSGRSTERVTRNFPLTLVIPGIRRPGFG